MEWFRIDVGFVRNRKHGRVARLLGVTRDEAVVMTLRVLEHTAEQYELDPIDDTPEELAEAALWSGDPDQFVCAMTDAGWLEQDDAGRLRLHGWAERQRTFVVRRDRARQRARDWRESQSKGEPDSTPDRTAQRTAYGTAYGTEFGTAYRTAQRTPDLPPTQPTTQPTTHHYEAERETLALSVVEKTPEAEMVLPLRGGSPWPVMPAKLRQWEAAYPQLDVRAHLQRAKQWLDAHPERRPAVKMEAFVVAWLNRHDERAAERAGRDGSSATTRRQSQAQRIEQEVLSHWRASNGD